MNFILNAGVNDELNHYLIDKIKISNQVALLMALVGVCYTVFSIYFYPPLVYYPAFCVLISFGTIALNNLGLYNISRFILSSLVLVLAYIYHGLLVQPEEGIIPSMMVIEFALTIIPWILIDFRERTLLTITLFVCYSLVLSQNWANDLLNVDVDSSFFRSDMISNGSYAFGILILVACLFFMQNKNFLSELSNEKLLVAINEKNDEMQKQRTELEQNLKEIEKARAHEERQNWVSRGIADISDILRQDNNEDIHNTILTSIVKFIDANQGCIFMVNTDDSDHVFLEMVACYAYERKKHFSKTVEIGQGLIGQCYLEKESIKLKELPEEFVNITSGLGEAIPTFVVIIPIMQDTRVTGVMEFALFHDLEDYQIEFLEKLGHNIASFFISNNMNVKTRDLLEQSHVQMEQLRAQEEEMRQNMEELQATQEEMQRKEREYLDRIVQLESEASENPG